jgi:hypothetical protein
MITNREARYPFAYFHHHSRAFMSKDRRKYTLWVIT